MNKNKTFKEKIKAIYFMLYPRKITFFPNIFSYIAQSRFFVWGRLWVRFIFFFLINRGKINTIETKNGSHISKVVHHNFTENFNLMVFNRGRIESLLYPLLSVPYVRRNAGALKVLSIGPRNEGELLLLFSHGFKWQNIVGIDLFSYSPKIKVMDMHGMTFEDNSFDIITSSRVLSYSKGLEVQKAINEIIRVAKNGAIVAIGIAWNVDPHDDEDYAGNRFDGWLDEIFSYFKDHIDYIYWRNEEKKDGGLGDMTTVFRIKK
ncbi:MAG: methyltransferase domain-containing protein [Patescibacteria group bacterium]